MLATHRSYAYSAGGGGEYTIFDLRDWYKPKQVDSKPSVQGIQGFKSPALGPNAVVSSGAGHKWNFVGLGRAVHTGSGGTAIFDVSKPRQPRLLTRTTDAGLSDPWNNFIHHNSWWPHRPRLEPGRRAELADLGGPDQGVFPQGAFCSSHWFDYHQSGIVAVAFYNGGVRLIDARDPRNLKRFGYAVYRVDVPNESVIGPE